ncbi:MAG: TRAP transporter substrate-binding protein DctP [Burkholderiaceae bacterium]
MLRGLKAALLATLAASALLAAPLTAQAEQRFRISVDTGANHITNITIKDFLERLRKATNGEVVGELFESGALYAARDEAKAIARGDLDMSVTVSVWLSAISPDLALLDLPLFSGRAPSQVNALVDGPVGKLLTARTEEKLGVKIPGRWFLLGFASTFGARKDIKSFEDLAGARIRVPGGAAFVARYKSLGGEGLSIPFPDVPMALSQGTIDGLLTTNETIRSAKLHEAGVKSAFVDQVSVLYIIPMVSKQFWTKLGDKNQKAFAAAWDAVVDGERTEALRRQDSAAADLAKAGVKYSQPSPQALKAVNDKLAALIPELVTTLKIDPAIVSQAQAELAKVK